MLSDILVRYLEFYPKELQQLKLLRQQIGNNEFLDDRRNFTGHVTAGAIILSADRKRVLLIHHKAYDQWQQPGGHWEKEEASPLDAAKREGEEETGIRLAKNITRDPEFPLVPFDIDSHPVPARPDKDEPPHHHHDFRYVFVTDNYKTNHQVEEVLSTEWTLLDDPKTKIIRRSIKKLRDANIIA